MTLFGVHVGLQHTTPDELRTVLASGRRSRLRMDLGVGPLLRSDRQTRRCCVSRSRQHARRPGVQHLEGALRVVGVLGRLSAPCCAGEGNHGDRPAVGWTRRDGHRRRLGESGIRRLRDRVPRCEGSPRPTRGRHPVPARVAARRRHRLRRARTSRSPRRATSRGRCRPSCRSGSAVAARSAR